MFKVYLTKRVNKSLKLLNEEMKGRIKEALRKLVSFPDDLDVKKLKGFKNKYCIRVGNYRIIIELHKDMIVVIDILPRKTAYHR